MNYSEIKDLLRHYDEQIEKIDTRIEYCSTEIKAAQIKMTTLKAVYEQLEKKYQAQATMEDKVDTFHILFHGVVDTLIVATGVIGLTIGGVGTALGALVLTGGLVKTAKDTITTYKTKKKIKQKGENNLESITARQQEVAKDRNKTAATKRELEDERENLQKERTTICAERNNVEESFLNSCGSVLNPQVNQNKDQHVEEQNKQKKLV